MPTIRRLKISLPVKNLSYSARKRGTRSRKRSVSARLVRELARNAADADVVERLARAADLVEDIEDVLAVAEAVEHARGRAEVVGERADADQMAVDAVEFRHDHADELRAARHLEPCELLDGACKAEIVVHRRDVVEPVRIGEPLHVGARLQEFLDAAMQVTEHRLGLYDAFAVERELHLQDAVRRRVLRPHVEKIRFCPLHASASFRVPMRIALGGAGFL